MSIPERYATAAAFRSALEARLKNIANREGTDLQRLRRKVAFDRLLCRVFRVAPQAWVLKGGYAMELRIAAARATKDIDLTFRSTPARRGEGDTLLLHQLREAAALDLGDGFSYLVGDSVADLDAAPYGGSRHPVEARMDGRTFVRFHLDAGSGDVVLEPVENLSPRDWLDFAGVPSRPFPALPPEQQFAEKYHAYTLPREGRPNSRVRDLVDMLLLIKHSDLKPDRVRQAMDSTFSRRGTHDKPEQVPDPPDFWDVPYEAMARSCDLHGSVKEGLLALRRFLESGGAGPDADPGSGLH